MRKIPALFLLFVVTSCLNTANCWITATNLVKIALKKPDNTPATITFTSITVPGTLTFIPEGAVTAINLPVDPAANETTFIFNYSTTVEGVTTNRSDALTLSYSNETQLISDECGAFQYQKDLAIVSTDFAKTKLINTSLLTTVTSNLEIYF